SAGRGLRAVDSFPTRRSSDLAAALAEVCADDALAPVAVRSSATTEDAEDASFAGLQDTYPWVKGARDVQARLRDCWSSLYSVPRSEEHTAELQPRENLVCRPL